MVGLKFGIAPVNFMRLYDIVHLISFHLLPSGCFQVCVCVRVNHLHRCKKSFVAGGMAAVSIAMPTKLRDSAGRECGGTLLYLHITYSPAPGRI